MWKKTADGSIIDTHGKVIFFSVDRFVKDICIGNCCFICGSSPSEKTFNNEHILPKWLLQRYDLFSQTIKLPNEGTVQYGRYTLPCCTECNSLLGEMIEAPISKVVKDGINSVNDFALNGNLLKLYVWMGLIFLKTHLKDRVHRVYMDERKNGKKIADEYDWTLLHHIHCVVRSFYNDCKVDYKAVGSFLTVPVKNENSSDQFDFSDLYIAQTMFLRIEDMAMFAVFDDSGGAMNFFRQKLDKITGPVSEIQLREIMVELAFLNLHMEERPIFYSRTDTINEEYRILCLRPELKLAKLDYSVRGKMMANALESVLPKLTISGVSKGETLKEIEDGSCTFLFDENGKFI